MVLPHVDRSEIDRQLASLFVVLRQEPEAEFAGDGQSVLLMGGAPLDGDRLATLMHDCKASGVDLVYFEFAPGRERAGPVNTVVLAERDGIVWSWSDCSIWRPLNGGAGLIMPRNLNVCFGYDGLALLSQPTRPTRAIEAGIGRAHRRLAFIAGKLTEEQVRRWTYQGEDRQAA